MIRLTTLLTAITWAAISSSAPAMNDKSIEVTRVFDAPIADAWNTWTTAEGFTAAMGADCTIELKPGGKFEIIWVPEQPEGERGSEGCTVLSFIPLRMFSFTWNAPPQFADARGKHTFVVVEFSPLGANQTKVTLRHLGWPDDMDENMQGTLEYFTAAWPKVLDIMASHHNPAAAEQVSSPEQRTEQALHTGHCYLFVEFSRPDLFETITPEESQALSNHFNYLKALTEQGTVIFAGPCTDMIGPGIVLLQEPDEAAARQIMQNDPAVKAGLFKTEFHPLELSLLREHDA